MIKYFENVRTLEELKRQYRELALKHHPDRGGTVKVMQAINAEYETLFARVKDIHANKEGEEFTRETQEAPEEFINIVNELMKMEGVHIEVIGCFIWLSGNTKEHKDKIKALGFRWSPNKSMWYKSPAGYKRYGKTNYTINEIRSMYHTEFEGEGRNDKKAKKRQKKETLQIQWAF